MYGQTEATARMSYLPWQYAESKLGSIGIAIPGGKFWLEDDTGNPILSSETTGNLVYQGGNVSLGYAESFHDLSKGDVNQGVLYTGDKAKMDKDGFYYLLGRNDRFAKVFGNRINLNELEEIIKEAGFDCACTGTEEKIQIYLTTSEAIASVSKLLLKCTGLHARAFSFMSIGKLPRNESGKLLYALLNKEDKAA